MAPSWRSDGGAPETSLLTVDEPERGPAAEVLDVVLGHDRVHRPVEVGGHRGGEDLEDVVPPGVGRDEDADPGAVWPVRELPGLNLDGRPPPLSGPDESVNPPGALPRNVTMNPSMPETGASPSNDSERNR